MASPEKAAALARMKLLATGLLVAVTVLFVFARREGLPWLAAFAEAAMIGALADWFAVVALFRRPLGLPIPHTAILPRNKARLADNLAVFIRDKFLDTHSLVGRLRAANPAERIATWLQDERNARLLADRLAVVAVQSLDFMDDRRVRRLVLHALRRRAGDLDLAGTVGRVLNLLTEDRRHQGLLDDGLHKLADWLGQPGVQQGFAGMIVDVANKEYPKIVAMLGLVGINPAELGEKVANGIVTGVNGLLDEVANDPNHPRRAAFDEVIHRYIERLQHDEGFRARIEQAKRDFLAHPGVGTYLQGLWADLRGWLASDLGKPDSRVRRKIASAASAIGASLATNPALRDSVNEHIEQSVEALAPELREGLSRHIAGTVRAWNDEDLVREIEQSVGRDLQFIRLNGTLVGGLIGLVLYAVTHLIS